MWLGLDNAIRVRDKKQVVYKKKKSDTWWSQVLCGNMEFDWLNIIQACEKFPNVHVVQWLGIFWLEFWTLFS